MKPVEQIYGELSALTISQTAKPKRALVLLHGVGSNERDLLEVGSQLSDDRLIVSMRAPITMGQNAFAWFHVQFTDRGPVHNWNEAKENLILIEEALRELSKQSEIAMDQISVYGFSQGAIMTVGLALISKLNFENYFASSGRTLPEFAASSREYPLADYKFRRVYVTHGTQDSKLPIHLGRDTEQVLISTELQLTYKEYQSEHTIAPEVLSDVKKWLNSK